MALNIQRLGCKTGTTIDYHDPETNTRYSLTKEWDKEGIPEIFRVLIKGETPNKDRVVCIRVGSPKIRDITEILEPEHYAVLEANLSADALVSIQAHYEDMLRGAIIVTKRKPH